MTALRFLLGLFEAGIYPALTLLVCTFYRRKEQVARLGCVWLCNGIGIIIGGLITYGIGHMNDLGIARWRWIMFILGGVTCFIGIIAFFFLIDNPKSRHLQLNAEQEILVEERTRDNTVVRTNAIKNEQIVEALKETRLWALCSASLLFCLRNGGTTIYNAQITRSFGYTRLQSVVLMVPIGAFDIIFILLAVYLVNKMGQTLHIACASMLIGTVGTLLMVVIPQPNFKLIGQYLALVAVPTYVLHAIRY
ncbi:hypothetical protein DFQ28_002723 [Apophysomyces sp. BC1034]|nr:hypothetical protein DFQ28_002723 [Apophysomyces sp. BC1034]